MRIKKVATQKHENSTSPFVREFVKKTVSLVDNNQISDVVTHLNTFPIVWPFPRGDLYHWIPMLNKFDEVYDSMVKKYQLKDGPQTIPFEQQDEVLLLAILDFSRMLVEECGNRSLYASSSHLSDLMNTISLTLLTSILRLAAKLGQRYYGSRSRTGSISSGANQMLLNSHYNINIDKVTKMATAFVGMPASSTGIPGKPGKSIPVAANDLTKLVHDAQNAEDPKGKGKRKATAEAPSTPFNLDDYSMVQMNYYINPDVETATTVQPAFSAPSQLPATPTPARRRSSLHKEHNANQTFDEAVAADVAKPNPTGMQFLEIPKSLIQSSSVIDILKANLANLPQEYHYELLQRVRVAKALTESLETRRQILGIRILAITNLAYVHNENTFQSKILLPDNDEPRRLQIVFQLAELVNLTFGKSVPRWLQTLAFGALEALSKHKIRIQDVNTALSVNVNHGTLLTMYRKAIAELDDEVVGNAIIVNKDDEEWRRALVELVGNLPMNASSGNLMISAGLIPAMVSALNLRTIRGTTYIARIAHQLDCLVYGTHNAFPSFASAKGLDALVQLVHDQVQSAMVELKIPGGTFPEIYRAPALDFITGYYRAYILKIVFKFMHHMMGPHVGNSDRLLRNLIDSPKLLEALRIVIANGKVFGSTVWATSVQILTTFIHNEPTSYAIIHEAKLSHTLFASMTGKEAPEPLHIEGPAEATNEVEAFNVSSESTTTSDPASLTALFNATTTNKKTKYQRVPGQKPAAGILPALDVMNTIPLAFGAICLNNTGFELFKSSGALETFFEIFESEDHVKAMVDSDTPTSLGSQFDELVRHHPTLKKDILDAVIEMVRKVVQLGKDYAAKVGGGAKIWVEDGNDKMIVSGGRRALAGDGRLRPVAVKAEHSPSSTNEDVEMGNAEPVDNESAIPVNDIDSPEQSVAVVDASDITDEQMTLDQVVDDEEAHAKHTNTHISTFIDVMARFLEGFLQHTSHSKEFVKRGGFDIVLEIYFLPCLPYDFATRSAAFALSRVIHFCGEVSSHVVMPVLLSNTYRAVAQLEPLLQYEGREAFFRPLTDQSYDWSTDTSSGVNLRDDGTKIVKDLVTAHSLCSLLSELFSASLFTSRSSNVLYQPATQQKYYDQLIPILGKLHRVCVWEEILLQKYIPNTWNEATKVKDRSLLVNPEDDILGLDGQELPQKSLEEKEKEKEAAEKVVLEKEGETSCFKNVKTIRFLLSQVPNNVTPFLQGLARILILRRSTDQLLKQQAFRIGDAMAEVMSEHLTWKRLDSYDNEPSAVTGRYSYWIIMLSSISGLLLDGTERSTSSQILTTILITFKQSNGIEAITDILKTFWDEIQDADIKDPSMHARLAHCLGGVKVILSLFAHLVNGKELLESPQTLALQSRDRVRERPDYFNPAQFLVELRMIILPALQTMWDSQSIDKAFSSIVRSVIEILGIILKGDSEIHAFTRADKGKLPTMISWRSFEPNDENIQQLTDMGFARSAALRALLYNNNSITTAVDWLAQHRDNAQSAADGAARPRTADSESSSEARTDPDAMGGIEEPNPAPATAADVGDLVSSLNAEDIINAVTGNASASALPPPPPPPPPPVDALAAEPVSEPLLVTEPAVVTLSRTSEPNSEGEDPDNFMAMSIDLLGAAPATALDPLTTTDKGKSKAKEEPDNSSVITIEDLEEARAAIRENLITRALDVLQVHHDVVFELSTLIMNAFSRTGETAENRREIVSTVAQSLMSLQMEDDIRPLGKTVSATAHFLGLIIQNTDFFDACLDDLKDQIPVLAGYIKVYPNEPAPWVAKVLLIVEKLLTESAQPKEVKFTPPSTEERPPSPPLETSDFVVTLEEQEPIFNAIMTAIPMVGKDETTALAIVRVLVLLTRRRELAVKIAEMQNMHRLFHMLKGLAGSDTSKIQSSILLILRHIIEDDATLKAIICSEIRHFYHQRGVRGARQVDTSAYIRNSAHLVHRNPEIFVEATNELCKLTRFDPNARHQQIVIKEAKPLDSEDEEGENEEETAKGEDSTEKAVEEKPREDVKEEASKPATEMKPPGVIQPDGVVHYLLSQLLACKDVDFNEGSSPPKEDTKLESDIEMGNGGTSSNPELPQSPIKSEKSAKQEFKAADHPTYLYRCFLLQSLTEILSCYNRSKIEFINFSRKAMPREPITPSKPRSGVLNYLLNELIPIGCLSHADDIPNRKRNMISNWAISVIVALCSQTGEVQSVKDEPDLVYVRKFVLESTLKSLKDAISSTEHLASKYGRMLNLSDLLYRMIAARPNATSNTQLLEASQKHLARVMFEKNFVAALTSALADIDLNFPHARRAIKYILRPLKLLSKTALDLGEDSDFVTPGGESDGMSIVSELSEFDDMEDEDEREETPDLYRNSALSMFEGGEMADDDEASEFDDEEDEMYEEMDFDEEEEPGSEDSDEDDDDEEGHEMDVEIVMENNQIEIETEDEDDEMSDDMDEDDHDDDRPAGLRREFDQVINYENEEEWDASDGDGGEGDEDDDEELEHDVDQVIEHVNRVIGGENDVLDDLVGDRDDGFIEDGEEDEEEDDEDDEMDDEDAIIHGDEVEIEDDEGGMNNVPWVYSDDLGDAPLMARGHHGRSGWYSLNPSDRNIVPRPRQTEENLQNPLLQPSTDLPSRPQIHRHAPDGLTDWVNAFDSFGPGGAPQGGAVSWLTTLMNIVSRGGGLPMVAPSGTLQFRVQGGPGGVFPADFEAMIGMQRPPQESRTRDHRSDAMGAVSFTPLPTVSRWQEEMRLAYGNNGPDKAQKVVNAILVCLVPEAVEAERVQKEKEEQLKKEEEERLVKENEERLSKEKAEAEEKAAREAEETRVEAERKAAEETAAAEAAAAEKAEEEPAPTEEQQGDAMEGIEATQHTESVAEAGPSEPAPRAFVMIRGREMDITGMDIDPEFLEALPEDMREEVLTNHLRERQAASATNEEPSEISQEFLEALPDDIRAELIQREQADQRRRDRERQLAASGQPQGPVDIDLASFLATLDPGLRQTVLLEQDDEALAQFPDAIVEEAQALRGDRRNLQQYNPSADVFSRHHVIRNRQEIPHPAVEKKLVRRGVIQMLDRAGVATLLRLMFVPQIGSVRTCLHEILLNVCENRQNRGEVINLLLSILQDGSADMTAVERSFAQLSVRAKQAPVKTPQSALKRNNTGLYPAQTSSEMSPLLVAQQCLAALTYLVNYNEHIPSYFLNEHENAVGFKRSASKKGKAKETPQSKASRFALNTLLGMLDRTLIAESTSVMDQLSSLLSEITRPLMLLIKKDKKKEEQKKIEAAPEVAPEASTQTPTGDAEVTEEQAPVDAEMTQPEEVPTETAAEAQALVEAVPTVAFTEQPTEVATTEAASEVVEAGPSEEKKSDEPKEDEKVKKQRTLSPPVVPDYNLRLVVNIITARECTSKTFRETLTTMLNLSAIPGAKDVFGSELIRQAQSLGGSILESLVELSQRITEADTGVEVQGLSKFSAGSSDQAKLLRTLTALDYLFDTSSRKKKTEAEAPSDEEVKSDEHTPASDVEILGKLYESLTFAPLWSKLGDCLTLIHDRENMLHVATILLPLIEALMVVCKNSGLNDKAASSRNIEKTPKPTSPRTSETSMENLFFTFTEDHRKILNQMVRNNPKLMSGSFALLVNNPKVLDFDNKRNYFNRRLHVRGTMRESHHSLQLNIRRDQVFLDSYQAMHFKNGDEVKYAKLNIRFHGEEGVDAGGVTREWFQVLARQMFNPDYALFTPVASDRTTFHPNKMSGVNPEHLRFFKFIGRVIGKALYEGRVLDCHFSRAVYKGLLGQSVSVKDMETLDLAYYNSLVWMLENDITDVITESFSVVNEEFGEEKIIPLIPDGENIPVTEDNKQEFVRLVTEYRLHKSVKEQMEHFLKGFHDIVPAELVAIFNEQELELLISGLPDIDVDDWRNNTDYHNFTASSPQIQWFWRAVRSFDKEERAKLLQFATGTSKVPLNGFKELEGMNGFSKFNVHRDYGSKDRLPSSHTCFNQIDLPEYDSYESLRSHLYTAITQGAEYFGFA